MASPRRCQGLALTRPGIKIRNWGQPGLEEATLATDSENLHENFTGREARLTQAQALTHPQTMASGALDSELRMIRMALEPLNGIAGGN